MVKQGGSEPTSVQVWLLQLLHQADKRPLIPLFTEPATTAPLPCNVNGPELPWSDLAWRVASGCCQPPGPWWLDLAGLSWMPMGLLTGLQHPCAVGRGLHLPREGSDHGQESCDFT